MRKDTRDTHTSAGVPVAPAILEFQMHVRQMVDDCGVRLMLEAVTRELELVARALGEETADASMVALTASRVQTLTREYRSIKQTFDAFNEAGR